MCIRDRESNLYGWLTSTSFTDTVNFGFVSVTKPTILTLKVFEWPPNPAGKFTADSKRRLETAVGNLSMEKFQQESSRRMPGHIREFNRLEPHSSHDLVFKIWLNNKTEAMFGVFSLWLWVTRNQISMGTTGISISRNIKFKILPSINASLSDFNGFFALKNNQNRHFCMYFHLRRLSRKKYNQSLQKSRTVPPDIVTSLVCL